MKFNRKSQIYQFTIFIVLISLLSLNAKSKLKQTKPTVLKAERIEPELSITDVTEEKVILGNCFVKMNGWFYNLYDLSLTEGQYILYYFM